jgi:hypothetical protein
MIGFIVGSRYPKVRYLAMPRQYVLSFAHHLQPSEVASMDDAIEVRTFEEFKDANKFSSTCKFTLFNSALMA